MSAHHPQGFGRVTRYEYTFALCEQMPDQISNCMSLPRTRRTLDENSRVTRDLLSDPNLFWVRRLA